MERYDAAIIGAGPDGLIAAQRLARAGLRVAVLERAASAGGRLATREFSPGFRASVYADEIPALPPQLAWEFDLPRAGAVFYPTPVSVCLGDGASVLFSDRERLAQTAPFGPAVVRFRDELSASRDRLAREPTAKSDLAWCRLSLLEALRRSFPDPLLQLHLALDATSGRAVNPFLDGTAVHLLAAGGGAVPAGGLGAVADALERQALAAGVDIRLGAEVADIALGTRRPRVLVLRSGERIQVRAVLSTVDLKRTFLELFAGHRLPENLPRRVAQFRSRGAAARVLLALDRRPRFEFAAAAPELAHGVIHVVRSLDSLAHAHDAWRRGAFADDLAVTLRVPSLRDPRLAPAGKAVMTATLSGVPARLFDGAWTEERRLQIVRLALAAAERAAPGISRSVVGFAVIVPADAEQDLALSDGDLDGGEVAPDQIFSFRPFPGWHDGRTPVRGLYLAGPSAAPSPFAFGAAAARAADTMIADLKGSP